MLIARHSAPRSYFQMTGSKFTPEELRARTKELFEIRKVRKAKKLKMLQLCSSSEDESSSTFTEEEIRARTWELQRIRKGRKVKKTIGSVNFASKTNDYSYLTDQNKILNARVKDVESEIAELEWNLRVNRKENSKASLYNWNDVEENLEAKIKSLMKRSDRIRRGITPKQRSERSRHSRRKSESPRKSLTSSQQAVNKTKKNKRKPTSQYTGVCYNKLARKWTARLQKPGDKEKTYLGIYDHELEAALVVQHVATKWGKKLRCSVGQVWENKIVS